MSSLTPLEHILEVVFGLKPDSPLHRALELNAYMSPEDLLMETDENLYDLKYPDDKNKNVPLIKGYASMVRIFKQFVAYQVAQGAIIAAKIDWRTITKEQFDEFRITYANSPATFGTNPNPTPSTPISLSTPQSPPVIDLV